MVEIGASTASLAQDAGLFETSHRHNYKRSGWIIFRRVVCLMWDSRNRLGKATSPMIGQTVLHDTHVVFAVAFAVRFGLRGQLLGFFEGF